VTLSAARVARGACLAVALLVGSTAATVAAADTVEYRVLATNKTSTMEKEMQDAAAAGFRFAGTMGGETAFGGNEVAVVMTRIGKAAPRYEYRLLATTKTSTNCDPLLDYDFETMRPTRLFGVKRGGAESEVLFLWLVSHHSAAQGAGAFANVHSNVIAQCEAQKNGLDGVIAVGLLLEHAESEVDFGLRESSTGAEAHAAGSVAGCSSFSVRPRRAK
jgi:hypothetical protein